ncbi:MAG: putative LPS assembly protein LptD, partial [Bacteroidota bacterium]
QQGQQRFNAAKLRFNFKNKKGIIYDVTTQQNDLYIKGGKSKFVGAIAGDTTSKNIIYSSNAIFTTCNHPQPHYGIRSRKQKVIADEIVIIQGANVELAGIPTPLVLPFGFFPINGNTRQQGILFPRDFEYSDNWGYGVRNLGYYFPINDYYNLSITGDIYLKGTWGVQATTQFRKRYRYSGNVSVGYARQRAEDALGNVNFNPSFFLRTTLNQDSKAHPAIRIGGNVNIQGNNYQQTNFNDAQSVLQNTLNSNLSFRHTFPGRPYTLSMGLQHTQNTRTRVVSIDFPNIDFQVQSFNPFKSKKTSSKERWYEKIQVNHSSAIKNRFVTTDTTFFSTQTLEDVQVGARHNTRVNLPFKLLKFFNLTPSVNYQETWHFKSQERTFDPTPVVLESIEQDASGEQIIVRDTTFGTLDTLSLWGFKPVRAFTTSLTLGTQLFGTLLFKGERGLKGLRHVLKPSFSFNYTPNYVNPTPEFAGYAADYSPGRGDYFGYIPTNTQDSILQQYSLFEGNIYSGPSQSGKQMSISYSLTNIFEAKYWSKKDSTDKKLKLFDNIYVRGNYNFANDTLQFSQTSMSGTTRLFKGLSTLSLNAVFDPYAAVTNEAGTGLRRVNRFYFEDTNKILRFVSASMRIGTTIKISELRRRIAQARNQEPERPDGQTDPDDLNRSDSPNNRLDDTPLDRNPPNTRPVIANESLLDLLDNFTVQHNLVINLQRLPSGSDTLIVQTHAIDLRGNLQLTPKWSVRVGNFGYDFKNKSFTYPDFGVSRNLHCWQLSFNFQPVRNTYSMTLQVAPGSSLDFLKIPYQRNNQDGQRFGGF